ncbi:MAG TPA: hypothetical protein PKE03_10340 [Bacteroidales bacterium]|nr:hypothetical protein [Bacteroidales bacterium]
MLITRVLVKTSSSDASWIDLKIQNQSGVIILNDQAVREGNATEAVITAYTPGITPGRLATMKSLAALGCICMAIAHTGYRWYLGTDDMPCSFAYSAADGGKAGSRSGFDITLKSTFGARLQSFESITDGGNIAITE